MRAVTASRRPPLRDRSPRRGGARVNHCCPSDHPSPLPSQTPVQARAHLDRLPHSRHASVAARCATVSPWTLPTTSSAPTRPRQPLRPRHRPRLACVQLCSVPDALGHTPSPSKPPPLPSVTPLTPQRRRPRSPPHLPPTRRQRAPHRAADAAATRPPLLRLAKSSSTPRTTTSLPRARSSGRPPPTSPRSLPLPASLPRAPRPPTPWSSPPLRPYHLPTPRLHTRTGTRPSSATATRPPLLAP